LTAKIGDDVVLVWSERYRAGAIAFGHAPPPLRRGCFIPAL
jgi:hypothetical protein